MGTRFSICIPNYNYEQYLGITLDSVFTQTYQDYEVLIADNASTDKSVEIIQHFASSYNQIHYKINQTNVGFAGNLDKSAEMASGDWMIMLSSDDLMTKEALSLYNLFITKATEKYGLDIAFCSAFDKIDGEGKYLEYIGPSKRIWSENDIDQELSDTLGYTVYKLDGATALKRCLTYFYNPFNFAATCYPSAIYKKVEGYSGSRLMNPDKWFHWKLLAKTSYVFYLDKPLFQYRWHQNNQSAQQQESGVLKYQMDEYRNSFEISKAMLTATGLSENMVKDIFVNRSILPFVFRNIKEKKRVLAWRILLFGLACYPKIMLRKVSTYALILLLITGPVGSLIARIKR